MPYLMSTPALPNCDAGNGGLILPEGFCAFVVAGGLGRARHLDVTADGDIYIRMRGSRGRGPEDPSGQGITALRDRDGDGRAEVIQTFADHYGTGLELRDDYLYVSTTTEVPSSSWSLSVDMLKSRPVAIAFDAVKEVSAMTSVYNLAALREKRAAAGAGDNVAEIDHDRLRCG